MKDTIRKYGHPPFVAALLHGGPGAAGDMKPVAEELSKVGGVLEFLQTGSSIGKQIEELHKQLLFSTDKPLVLIGYSWGAWLAILFYQYYPELIKKIIVISSGSFDDKYNVDLNQVRLSRLSVVERKEAKHILNLIMSDQVSTNQFSRLGQLMEKSDSYDLLPEVSENVTKLDLNIHRKVWNEAKALRESGELVKLIKKIQCPLVAIHGEYDPHPIKGIEEPFSNCVNFKMISLQKCGHIPWKEKYAKDYFYHKLKEEIQQVLHV